MMLDLFSLHSVFCNATESDSQQNPGGQVQSYLSTFGFGLIFSLLLSLFLSGKETKDCVGCKPLLIQKMIFRIHQSIHDSGGWVGCGGVGGSGGGERVLNWAFSAKLSKQNTQINMSAYCTGGKPAHRCCCLVLKHNPEC